MIILVISDNPLFTEVLTETLSSYPNAEIEVTGRESGKERIDQLKPGVIIFDETIAPEKLEQLLASARDLPRSRMLLVNLNSNLYVVLNSACGMIQKSDDLIEAIGAGKIQEEAS